MLLLLLRLRLLMLRLLDWRIQAMASALQVPVLLSSLEGASLSSSALLPVCHVTRRADGMNGRCSGRRLMKMAVCIS